jgi:hypothetical protein
MKLWLDDERDPKSIFIQDEFWSSPDMIWCKSVSEAINYLETGKVREISLDHDLGLPQTGYDLACWIEENAYNGKLPFLEWRIHSRNSGAAHAMYMALKNADRYWEQLQNNTSRVPDIRVPFSGG